MGIGEMAVAELAARMIATGAVVVVVMLVAEGSGPIAGGVVAGLPMVLGPGFFFLLRDTEALFVAEAAAYSLLSLSATQMFLSAYVVVTRRVAPIIATCLAIAVWTAAATLFHRLPPEPLIGILLFAFTTVCARSISSPFLTSDAKAPQRQGYVAMILRAIVAGLLVAVSTVAAGRLGAGWSGLVMAFPIGYLVVSLTVRVQLGIAGLAQMLHSALLGTTSLAVFCFALSIAVLRLSPVAAFFTASCASAAVTTILLMSRTMVGCDRGRRSANKRAD